MRKIILVLVLLRFGMAGAQESINIEVFEFSDSTIPQVILKLEEKTNNKFYFLPEWFDDRTISRSYTDVNLKYILEDIFADTNINFFIRGGRIILTHGSVIYNTLPSNFLTPEQEVVAGEDEEAATKDPVFYSGTSVEEGEIIETITIGKENRTDSRRTFILTGRITTDDGEPVLGINILLKNRNLGTVTNATGYFELRVPKGISIFEAGAMGTEVVQKRLIVYGDGTLNLNLNESFEELDEVLLETNARENVRSAISGVERIDIAEIKTIPLILGERDILKVAATLPGISTVGEASSGYNVRGGKTDQNLFLLDEGVIYNPTHFFGIFSGLNPFTTGSATIYKGSIPAEFGGRLSSVFDIETKNANNEKFAGEASIGPVTSNLSLEIPIVKEKSGLILGGRSTYSNWILNALDDENLRNSQASFFDIIAKYTHNFNDNNEFNATAYYSRDVFSITSDSLFNYSNRLVSLSYKKILNEKHQGELVLVNSNYNFNIDYESNFNNNFSSGYAINETELKLKLNYFPSNKHSFNYGVNSKFYLVAPGEIDPLDTESLVEHLSIPKERGLESAVYLEDSYEVNDRLLLNAGLRFSFYAALGPGSRNIYQPGAPRRESSVIDNKEYGSAEVIEAYGGPEVRISARYFLLSDFSAKISYNNTYQYIHTLSNNTTASPTDTYMLSNEHIKPQRASQASLGLYKNFNNNIYELSLEGYYKTANNLVDYKVGADLFLNENIETEVLQGQGRAYGAEFLIRKNEGRLNGYLGYTYSRSLIKLDGEFPEERVNSGSYFPTNFDKPHDLSLIANYKLTERFSFSANFIYQTGRPITYPIAKYTFNNAEYVLYSDRNRFRIPDYYRLDVSFNVEGNHRIEKFAHSFWNISVYNILGRNNPYSVFFVTNDGEVKAFQSSIFSIPIPTITYNFRF